MEPQDKFHRELAQQRLYILLPVQRLFFYPVQILVLLKIYLNKASQHSVTTQELILIQLKDSGE